MSVLTKREVWRKPTAVCAAVSPDLTAEETANVRTALRFLRARLGGGRKAASALRVPCKQVEKLCSARGRPGAGMALRIARAVRVNVEDVLGGAWPPEGACPHCGRS